MKRIQDPDCRSGFQPRLLSRVAPGWCSYKCADVILEVKEILMDKPGLGAAGIKTGALQPVPCCPAPNT